VHLNHSVLQFIGNQTDSVNIKQITKVFMKTEIEKHMDFKAIDYTLGKYPEAFTEKPDIQSARESFSTNTTSIGEILSQLMRPVSTVRSPKIDSESRLRKDSSKMIGIGLSLATTMDNQPLVSTLLNYDVQCKRCSAYRLYENSLHVHSELAALEEVATGNGLTAEKLAAFKSTVDAYGETLDITGYRLTDRRKSRQDLKNLIKANNKLLRFQLDTFIRYLEDEFPVLYSEYMFLRKRKRKRAGNTEVVKLCDISGTVTNSETGDPLANAVITLLTPETVVETDEDGYYILDELQAGEYTFTCHLPGYEVPAEEKVTAEAGESLVVDFSLTPVTPAEETPAT
jgi:hypothetical protein